MEAATEMNWRLDPRFLVGPTLLLPESNKSCSLESNRANRDVNVELQALNLIRAVTQESFATNPRNASNSI